MKNNIAIMTMSIILITHTNSLIIAAQPNPALLDAFRMFNRLQTDPHAKVTRNTLSDGSIVTKTEHIYEENPVTIKSRTFSNGYVTKITTQNMVIKTASWHETDQSKTMKYQFAGIEGSDEQSDNLEQIGTLPRDHSLLSTMPYPRRYTRLCQALGYESDQD